jgi:hypothetical protein
MAKWERTLQGGALVGVLVLATFGAVDEESAVKVIEKLGRGSVRHHTRQESGR